jgi:cardiolipin synthase
VIPTSPISLRSRVSSLWQRLLRYGQRNRLPVSEGNAVRPLLSGCQILECIRTQIENARTTVHLEMYTWADDRTGRDLLARLQKAQARGVQIRGVVDYVGSWDAVGMFETSGLDIRFYHPIGWRLPWRLWHRRDHRKLLIVDGTRAVVSSANWADEYNDEIPPQYYRDLGLELQGPAVEQLEDDFRKAWMRVGGRMPAPARSANPWASGPGWFQDVSIQIVSSLNGGGRILRRHLLLVLRQLQRRALIANAYFIPDPSFLRVLLRVVRRGVDVDLIVPGNSDHRLVQAASRATFVRLLRAGGRIWERRERVLHVKVAILDGDLVLLGSANLDSRSFRHNLELNLMLRSEGLANAMQEALAMDQTKSRLLSMAEWEVLPLWRKMVQRFAYLFWWWF